jgi:hypothetical protein
MRATGRVVQEHRAVRSDRLDIIDELDRLVGEIDAEVVALLRRGGGIRRVVVVDQVGIPLAGLGAEEPVEPLEAPPDRPVPLGRGQVHLVLGSEMPFPDRRRAEPAFDQHLGQGRALRPDVAVG